ncbi:TetR/AcrR family transcriptional regulator [Priestia aryabhattai]|uniref:TetR/AcrR family transcriptional regulator n=1 Tax=Priestia aryabhattai TaxID=412384 RepID=UPI003D2E3531
MKVRGVRNTNTRQSIEEAFQNLLMKKKLDNITIKNITEKANVNRATFYAHFDDKYQLFEDMIYRAICQDIYGRVRDLTDLDNNHIEILFKSIYAFLNNVVSMCPYSFLDIFPLLRKKMIDVLHMHIQSKLAQLEKKVDPFRSLMFSSMLYEAAEISILQKSKLNQNELIDELTKLIVR